MAVGEEPLDQGLADEAGGAGDRDDHLSIIGGVVGGRRADHVGGGRAERAAGGGGGAEGRGGAGAAREHGRGLNGGRGDHGTVRCNSKVICSDEPSLPATNKQDTWPALRRGLTLVSIWSFTKVVFMVSLELNAVRFVTFDAEDFWQPNECQTPAIVQPHEDRHVANRVVPCARLARARRRNARGWLHVVARHPPDGHRRLGSRSRRGRVRPERRDQVRVVRAPVHDHPDLLRGGSAGDDQGGHRQREGVTLNPLACVGTVHLSPLTAIPTHGSVTFFFTKVRVI